MPIRIGPAQRNVDASKVRVLGQIHQHIFCGRLDVAVDGDENSFVECNTFEEPAVRPIRTATVSTNKKPC